MKGTCFIYRVKWENWVTLDSPYNERFVTGLKDLIPFTCRKWDPEDKVWSFEEDYLEAVGNLALEYYEHVFIETTECGCGEVERVNLRTGEIMTQLALGL